MITTDNYSIASIVFFKQTFEAIFVKTLTLIITVYCILMWMNWLCVTNVIPIFHIMQKLP